VFVGLARGLEDELKVASPDAKQALARGFETFLKQIRDETTDFNVLNWVAETFFSLGSGLQGEGPAVDESTRYLAESRRTFEKILKESKPDPKLLVQIRIRLATVARQQRDFAAAPETYVEVLTNNSMLINVQVEAARTYQQWAALPGQESLYEKAIGGGNPGKDGRNIVWGWGRIAQVTARYPKFRDTFHEANVNTAWCRVLLAGHQQGTSKERLLSSAWNGVVVTQRLYPDLGGDAWTEQYDSVLRRIQQSKGESPIGLKALPSPAGRDPAEETAEAVSLR
jgi:hypothetical protein